MELQGEKMEAWIDVLQVEEIENVVWLRRLL